METQVNPEAEEYPGLLSPSQLLQRLKKSTHFWKKTDMKKLYIFTTNEKGYSQQPKTIF